MRHDLFIAGYGGQGVLLAGNLISYAALHEGNNVSFFPAYGVEKRGGGAMCTVIFSKTDTGSPIVGHPSVSIFLNQLSFDKYATDLISGGICIINSCLIDIKKSKLQGIQIIPVNMNQIALELGDIRMMNMVACGAYSAAKKSISKSSITDTLKKALPERNHHLIPANTKAIEAGFQAVYAKKA